METVIAAFYRPEGEHEALMNLITSWVTGQFVHVELLFVDPHTGKQNLASGVWANQTVFFKRKTFGRDSWSFKSIQVTKPQADKMRAFCADAAAKDIPFNRAGFYRCCSPFPRKTDHTCYFCSELAICAFQNAGLYNTVIASMVTPTALWDLLNIQNQHVAASPLLGERIAKKGLCFNKQRPLTKPNTVRRLSTDSTSNDTPKAKTNKRPATQTHLAHTWSGFAT